MRYLVILFFFLNISVLPQNLTIKGKIIDSETLQPLPSANLVIAGTGLGTTTEEDGSFVLTGKFTRDDILEVSYVGYSTVKIALTNEDLNNIIIRLLPKIIPSLPGSRMGSAAG